MEEAREVYERLVRQQQPSDEFLSELSRRPRIHGHVVHTVPQYDGVNGWVWYTEDGHRSDRVFESEQDAAQDIADQEWCDWKYEVHCHWCLITKEQYRNTLEHQRKIALERINQIG